MPRSRQVESAYYKNRDVLIPSITYFNSAHGATANTVPYPNGTAYAKLANWKSNSTMAPYSFGQNRDYYKQLTISIPVVSPCKTKTSQGKTLDYCKAKNFATTTPKCDLKKTYDTRTACHQQHLLAASAGMMAASYVANCQYLKELTVSLNNDVCFNMVGGFTAVFVGHGLIGLMYIMVLVVGIRGKRVFQNTEPGAGMQARKVKAATLVCWARTCNAGIESRRIF